MQKLEEILEVSKKFRNKSTGKKAIHGHTKLNREEEWELDKDFYEIRKN